MFAIGVSAGILLSLLALYVFYFYSTRNLPQVATDPQIAPLNASPPASPLTMISFQQALEVGGLEQEIEDYSKKLIGFSFGLDAANVAIQEVSLSDKEMRIAWGFTKKRGMKRFKSKKAIIQLESGSGRALPFLVVSETHKFIEQAKGALDISARIAEVSASVVAIAHVISNADLVRRMKTINRKIDVLARGRAIDQEAKLAKIYQGARERLQEGINEAYLMEMRSWRDDLFELRRVWRTEIEDKLRDAPDTRKSKFLRPSTWLEKKREQALKEHLIDVAHRIRLTRLSLLIDLCLAHETRTTDVFITVTVADESKLWSGAVDKLNSLADEMRTEEGDGVRALAGACQGYRDALYGLSYVRNETK